MSKSVRDYTNFAAKANSTKGITRQGSRFCPIGILRLFVSCTLVFSLFFALPANSYAQLPPGFPEPPGWRGTGDYIHAGVIALDVYNPDTPSYEFVRFAGFLGNAGTIHGYGTRQGAIYVDGNAEISGSPLQVINRGEIFNLDEFIVGGHLTIGGTTLPGVPVTGGPGTLRDINYVSVGGDMTMNISSSPSAFATTVQNIDYLHVGRDMINYITANSIGDIFVQRDLHNNNTLDNIDTISVGRDMFVGTESTRTTVGQAGIVRNVGYINVERNLSNYGSIVNPDSGPTRWMGYIDVRGHLQNGDWFDQDASITNFHIAAGSLQNVGTIDWTLQDIAVYPEHVIDVSGHLENGFGIVNSSFIPIDATARNRGSAVIRGTTLGLTSTSGPMLHIAAGSLTNYADGQIISWMGRMDVGAQLINEGIIQTEAGAGYWDIYAGSIFNDGRLNVQMDDYYLTPLYYSRDTLTDGRWGQIYDAFIYTDGNLVNQGAKAVIDGMATTDYGKSMHIGGRTVEDFATYYDGATVGHLYNLDGALITGYGEIIVHGGFVNRGATLIAGHWNDHVSEHPMQNQSGFVSIWENMHNIHETRLNEVYGGIISSFDYFHVHGSVLNDAYSTITGTQFDTVIDPEDPDDPPIIITGTPGRRANVLGGTMYHGTYDDGRSVLNVEGLINLNKDVPGSLPFYGLYNEGYIGEIDVIFVGSTENAILWNAYPSTTPLSGARRADGLLIRNLPRHYGTIYDVGIINATNLYNSGTISEVDVEVRISYALFNDVTGVLDGLSTFHTEWNYSGLIDTPENGDPIRTVVVEDMRADLIVGRASLTNPLVEAGLIEAGDGVVNYGIITNFETITTQGHLHNYGQIGTPVMTNSGLMGGVTSVTVGSNLSTETRADLYNYGALENIDEVTVTGNIVLGEGTTLGNIGTITARSNVRIDGTIDGGFKVLSAREGDLYVAGAWQRDLAGRRLVDPDTGLPMLTADSASLTIAPGAVASGDTSVQNYGTIINGGLLSSAMGVLNHGVIENDGLINAFGSFQNHGVVSGNGMIYLASGVFENAAGGVISGNLTIGGNFQNVNGTIVLFDPQDIIRVTNGGAAALVGGTVDVQYSNPVVGEQYMFLAADYAGNLNVTQNFRGLGSGETGSVLDFTPSFGYWDGNRYVAGREWSRNNQYYWVEFQRAYSYGSHGRTPNQIAIGTYLDTIGAAPVRNSGLWNLFVELDAISDDVSNPYFHPDYKNHQGQINPAALKALDELSGAVYATIGVASVHNVGVINRSLADALRSDVFQFSFIGNPNNAIRGQAIAPLRYNRWGTLFGIGGTSNNDGNASGYEQSFGGLLAGFDRAFWTGTRVGAYFSVANGDITMKSLNEKTDVTNIMVGMYMRQEMYFGYGLVTAGFGGDTYKTKRNLTMLGHRAESKFNGTIGTIYLERGIDIPVYHATVQPYASFQVVSISQDKFTERMWNKQGLYTNVGLEGIKGRTESYMMSIGARMSSTPIPMRWGQLALTANTAWFHDFNGDKDREFVGRITNPGGSNYGTQFSNAKFKVAGNDPKQDWFNFGFGLHIDRNSTRVFVGADLFTNSRQSLFSGYGGWGTSW